MILYFLIKHNLPLILVCVNVRKHLIVEYLTSVPVVKHLHPMQSPAGTVSPVSVVTHLIFQERHRSHSSHRLILEINIVNLRSFLCRIPLSPSLVILDIV